MGIEAPNTEKDVLGTRSEVEVVGGCRRRVKASIPVEKVREELDRNYRQLSQSVQLPGFRRGHVPRRLLEARYGEEIEADVKEMLLAASFSEVVEGKELKVLGSPRFENVSFAKDADFTYEVELEVHPEFDLDGYRDVEVEWEALPVKEEYVDLTLKSLQSKHSKLAPIEPSAAGADDYFRGTYRLHRGDVLVKTSEKVGFVPSARRLEAFSVPDLPERLASWDRSPETPLVLDVKVPPGYPDEVLRGADLRLEFQLEETLRRELPPMGDDLAREEGAENLDALKALIREEVTRKLHRDEELLVDQRIMEKLTGKTSMDLPEGLFEGQKKRLRLETEYKLLEEGLAAEEIERRLEEAEEKDTPGEEIRRALKSFFILDRIAEIEKIFVTEREIDERVRGLSLLHRVPEERLREDLRKSGRLEELRTLMRHEKVRKFLRKHARVLKKEGEAPGKEEGAPGKEEGAPGKEEAASPASGSGSPAGPADPSPSSIDPVPAGPGPGDRREGAEEV